MVGSGKIKVICPGHVLCNISGKQWNNCSRIKDKVYE